MAFQSEFILLLAGDVKILGQYLGSLPHDQSGNRIGQAELDARNRLKVPRPKSHHGFRPLPHTFGLG
jgi:hypothetical protein